MTVGKGEIENREYYRWERGWGVFYQRSHDRWKGRGAGWRGREKGGREERGEGGWVEPWAIKIS